jgi:hypothetical protein
MDSRWIATWIYEIYRDLVVDMDIYRDLLVDMEIYGDFVDLWI